MTPASRAKSSTQSRGRRDSRASGDERERAILDTAERLLAERPLSEISVDDLARGAGISRPSFYFYFPSKDAVVLTIVDRLVETATQSREETLELLAAEPRAGLRHGIESFYSAFASRRSVILAGAELRATNADARKLWSQVMDGWVADVTAAIESERARGAAPPGQPARDLAIALVQMNERALYATFATESPSIEDERVLDVLVEIWLRTIYGDANPD